MARRPHPDRLRAHVGADRRAGGALSLRLEDHGRRPRRAVPRDRAARAHRPERRRPRVLQPRRRPGGPPAHAPAVLQRAALHPVPGNARAPQERRGPRGRLRADVGPAPVPPGPRARRRRRLEDGGPPPPDRALAVPRQDPRRGLHRARRGARALPGGRGLRVPVARGGLRPPAARGHGLRHARRLLDGRRARRSRRRRGALRAGARHRGALAPDRAGARGRRRAHRAAGRRPRPRRPVPLGGRGAGHRGGRRRGRPGDAHDPPGPAADRHRRPQGRGLRDRLLHPQPRRGHRAAARERAVPLPRLRPRRRPRRPAAAARRTSRSSRTTRPATRSRSSRASPGACCATGSTSSTPPTT